MMQKRLDEGIRVLHTVYFCYSSRQAAQKNTEDRLKLCRPESLDEVLSVLIRHKADADVADS